ncbi:hypothetical protein RUM43_002379 [Polyplax serrata]|uniref:Retroviral polymerase SH3-like domain-containing protein n=1 Tax=Polyplax serrata TaxID=468196 RepID=A0AAN8NYR3_POLSC
MLHSTLQTPPSGAQFLTEKSPRMKRGLVENQTSMTQVSKDIQMHCMYMYISKYLREWKFGEMSEKFTFIGHGTRGYLLWDSHRDKTVYERNVKFIERERRTRQGKKN